AAPGFALSPPHSEVRPPRPGLGDGGGGSDPGDPGRRLPGDRRVPAAADGVVPPVAADDHRAPRSGPLPEAPDAGPGDGRAGAPGRTAEPAGRRPERTGPQ